MNIFRKTLGLAVTLTAVLTSGCASIVGDSKYPVAVSTTPSGASYTIKNHAGQVVHSGTTPNTVVLKSGRGYFKGETYTVTFHKDGYADTTTTLNSSLSGWYWGNILFGGLIGMLIVDPLTGAMYKLPDDTNSNLGSPVAAQGAGPDLTLMSIDELPESARAKLVRIN
ncbi:hypothetical protein IQ22_01860 [Pseudomonas duriflava]|uniref:PEGA domain-containing protein n=1 Tax=Pseudomonas duriflava TaxID=459528 RepID=A0A562QE25_9PSED|nr:hypothetical protein [Pseudomonas duriflava]TWI54953.1 hypothetical protein IQ22_01860 [Pseudomonas duriflava]